MKRLCAILAGVCAIMAGLWASSPALRATAQQAPAKPGVASKTPEKIAPAKTAINEKTPAKTVPEKTANAPSADLGHTLRPVLAQYCVSCHGPQKQEGDLRLDQLGSDLHQAEALATWETVLRRVQSREMPPESARQLPEKTYQELTKNLGTALQLASAVRQREQGRTRMRRLNRIEYQNTIHALLHIDAAVKELLPEDGQSAGFDNVDAALDLSSVLLEKYLETADAALDAAIVRVPPPNSRNKNPTVASQRPVPFQRKINLVELHNDPKNNLPFGKSTLTRGDQVIFINETYPPKTIRDARVPYDGHYKFRAEVQAYRTDGKSLGFLVYAGNFFALSGFTWLEGIHDAPPERTVVEFTIRLNRNDTIRIVPYGVTNSFNPPQDYDGPGLAMSYVEVEGPLIEQWPPRSHVELVGDLDLAQGTLADAEQILKKFLPRAFRRPVAPAEVQPYLALVAERLQDGTSFEPALRVGLKAILCSPDFLYLRARPGLLDDYALASRLSYFLGSGPPDAELLSLAEQGKLHDPQVLRGQVERLLKGPRAAAFTENFTGQWLGLRNLEATIPDRRLYPEFDELLAYSSRHETRLFFDELLHNDLSLLNFVDSDFAILNQRLAEHYEIPGVTGTAFRKVNLPENSHRGGVLTHASILRITANGTTTSPVLRGVWILDRLLGQPVPPPPQNVPAIEPDTRGASSIRDLIAKHRTIETCASCHTRIDPVGFALENYDVIGGYRERYRTMGTKKRSSKKIDGRNVQYGDGPEVDASDVLPNGQRFTNLAEFQALILQEPDVVARGLAEKLLTYATGHALESADEPVLDGLVARVRSRNYGLRTLVHEIVQSPLFRSQ